MQSYCVLGQVRQLYTAPTLIRALEALDDKWVTKHDRSSLKVLGTVGEPINPRAWHWFFEVCTACMQLASSPDLMLSTCACKQRGTWQALIKCACTTFK